MPTETSDGNTSLAEAIRNRRIELGLSIKTAAEKAGIGAKTWSNYESGSPIRGDKVRGVCKALNWTSLLSAQQEKMFDDSELDDFDLKDLEEHEAWSKYLASTYGEYVAVSFAIGSDMLIDQLYDDIDEITLMPRHTHVGELTESMLEPLLPLQFVTRYDHEFLYALLMSVFRLREQASSGNPITAKSVIEELALYLMEQDSFLLMKEVAKELGDDFDAVEGGDLVRWSCDIRGGDDLEASLFSDCYLYPDDIYHFDNWLKEQFNTDPDIAPQE